MSLRFRRSIRIAPGVRLTVTKTGFGVTAGPKGAHYSVHSLGQRTVTAATDAFRDALRKTVHRDPGLLKAVRYDRALAFEQLGQRARATADLERLYAADPGYEDVRARLSALGRP